MNPCGPQGPGDINTAEGNSVDDNVDEFEDPANAMRRDPKKELEATCM
jgi:hypothetical protein